MLGATVGGGRQGCKSFDSWKRCRELRAECERHLRQEGRLDHGVDEKRRHYHVVDRCRASGITTGFACVRGSDGAESSKGYCGEERTLHEHLLDIERVVPLHALLVPGNLLVLCDEKARMS